MSLEKKIDKYRLIKKLDDLAINVSENFFYRIAKHTKTNQKQLIKGLYLTSGIMSAYAFSFLEPAAVFVSCGLMISSYGCYKNPEIMTSQNEENELLSKKKYIDGNKIGRLLSAGVSLFSFYMFYKASFVDLDSELEQKIHTVIPLLMAFTSMIPFVMAQYLELANNFDERLKKSVSSNNK